MNASPDSAMIHHAAEENGLEYLTTKHDISASRQAIIGWRDNCYVSRKIRKGQRFHVQLTIVAPKALSYAGRWRAQRAGATILILTADYADLHRFLLALLWFPFYWPDCHRWMTAGGRLPQITLRLMMELCPDASRRDMIHHVRWLETRR